MADNTGQEQYGADVIVDALTAHNVPYVFGIPGAKIDKVFDTLEDKGPTLVVTRHEQNAAFMAQAVGRITGHPGVVIATSGPGASNLATGLVTATAEGDPVVAIGGQVKRADLLKLTHQSMDNAALFKPITKYSVEIHDPETISEIFERAWREARDGKGGASFISVPQDVVDSPVKTDVIPRMHHPRTGVASEIDIEFLAQKIQAASLPVLLVGLRGSGPKETAAIRRLVQKAQIPVVETFQAAGVISRELVSHFFGRVGLFRNQPGDNLLKRADLVITVGYDPIEYEARNWNAEREAQIIVIDKIPTEIDPYLYPQRELIGNIARTLDVLADAIEGYQVPETSQAFLRELHAKLDESNVAVEPKHPGLVHPLQIIESLQDFVDDSMTVTVDVGSHYIWMARHFRSYEPRTLLFSNGMQTLGVALPWAIAAALIRPNTQIVSVSGDGGFLFSAQDLETAVRMNLNIIHIIWNDGKYNMVEFQEEMKYGRSSGVDFGPVDFVKYAEAFGATGFRATSKAELDDILAKAATIQGPVLIDVPVDYSDNEELGKQILPDQFM